MNFSYLTIIAIWLVVACIVIAFPLHDQFAVLNYQTVDRQFIVDCFVRNKYASNKTTCLPNGDLSPPRHQFALDYLQNLTDFLSEVDTCLELEEAQMGTPLPDNCNFLDEQELIEHCFFYHQFSHYELCENISWPSTALPTDVRTMFIYTSWLNASFEFEEQLEEYRMGMEGIPDPMAVVMFCLHNATWTSYPKHECNRVTSPVKGETYTKQERLYQKMFNQKRRDELRHDCKTFHKGQKFAPCKWITWRA